MCTINNVVYAPIINVRRIIKNILSINTRPYSCDIWLGYRVHFSSFVSKEYLGALIKQRHLCYHRRKMEGRQA